MSGAIWWVLGAATALASINLHKARLASPDPKNMELGSPINDAVFHLLAWVSLVVLGLLAIQHSGVFAALQVVAGLALLFWQLRLRLPLYRLYRWTNALAIVSPVFISMTLHQLLSGIPVVDLTSMIMGEPPRSISIASGDY